MEIISIEKLANSYKVKNVQEYLALRGRVSNGAKWLEEHGGLVANSETPQFRHYTAMGLALLDFELDNDLLNFDSPSSQSKLNILLTEYEINKD